MKVKRSLVMLCLATGLSLGGLYGCGGGSPTPETNNSSPRRSKEIRSNENADQNDVDQNDVDQNDVDQNDVDIEAIQQQLQAVTTAYQNLNTFINDIVVTENGTKVNVPVDYTKAQQIVDHLATTYNNFKRSLSDDIKAKINFDEISPHLDNIDNVLKPDSTERVILNDLAKGYPLDTTRNGTQKIEEYGEAQTKLSQLQINNQPIYSGTVDDKDGSGQRIAVKKLLLYKIYKPIEELTKVTIQAQSYTRATGTETRIETESSNQNNLRNNRGNSEENNSIQPTSDNAWILSLLNTIALLGAIGIGSFVIYKISQLNQQDKEKNAFLIKLEPEVDQQTQEQIQAKQELDTNLKKIQDSLQEIKDSFIVSSSPEENDKSDKKKFSVLPIKFVTQEKENTPIDLSQEKYNKLIDLLNKLGSILDENYTAMLQYKNFRRYDEAVNTTIKTIKQSIDEYLKIREDKNQKINQINHNDIKKIINSFSTEISRKIEESLTQFQSSIPVIKHNLTSSSIEHLIEDERQTFKNTIIELTKQRNDYELQLKELKDKDDKIEQLKTVETEQTQQQYTKLLEKHQELQKKHENLLTRYQSLESIETERDIITKNLDNLERESNQAREQLQQTIWQKDADIEKLKEKIKKLEAIIDNKPPQDDNIPSEWQTLINAYLTNPENIKNQAEDEVTENEDTLEERSNNASQPVIFNHDTSNKGYYIIASGKDYLLFPKQHGIPVSQEFTAKALFDGYEQDNTSKFTSIVPAQVSRYGTKMWQLKHQGRLKYS